MKTTEKQALPRALVVSVFAVGALLGPVIGLVGLSVSFQTIDKLATGLHLPGPSWFYPLGIDLGILALLVGDWMYTIRGRNGWPLRLLAWALTGFTVWVNWHGGGDGEPLDLATLGMTREAAENLQSGLHTIMPILWVVMVEAVRLLVLGDRRAASGATDRSVPVVRWVLAPVRTALLFRRMRLWGIESYPLALALEAARLHGIDIVRSKYKVRRWRRKVSRLLRIELTTGNLPDEVRDVIAQAVESGRMTGWKRAVYWWVMAELEAAAAPTGDAADAPTGGAVSGAADGVAVGGSEYPTGAPIGAPIGTPIGVPSGPHQTPPLEFSSAPHRAPLGAPRLKPFSAPSGAPTGGPTDGAAETAPRAPRKTNRTKIRTGNGTGNDDRESIDGLTDEEVRKRVEEIATAHEKENDGAELTPTALRTKHLKIGPDRAKRLVTAHYATNVPALAQAN